MDFNRLEAKTGATTFFDTLFCLRADAIILRKVQDANFFQKLDQLIDTNC